MDESKWKQRGRSDVKWTGPIDFHPTKQPNSESLLKPMVGAFQEGHVHVKNTWGHTNSAAALRDFPPTRQTVLSHPSANQYCPLEFLGPKDRSSSMIIYTLGFEIYLRWVVYIWSTWSWIQLHIICILLELNRLAKWKNKLILTSLLTALGWLEKLDNQFFDWMLLIYGFQRCDRPMVCDSSHDLHHLCLHCSKIFLLRTIP